LAVRRQVHAVQGRVWAVQGQVLALQAKVLALEGQALAQRGLALALALTLTGLLHEQRGLWKHPLQAALALSVWPVSPAEWCGAR
jgi:hypothetical protein